jgi:hypothetical protein
MKRHEFCRRNDAIRFSRGRLTDNESRSKPKPEPCRPSTSDALDHALETKDDSSVCRIVGENRPSKYRDMVFGSANDRKTNSEKKNQSQSRVDQVLRMPWIRPGRREGGRGVCVIMHGMCRRGNGRRKIMRFFG